MNKQSYPPGPFLRFFRWYCHRDYVEDLEGDLLERFERVADQQGPKTAKWLFLKEVLLLFRPGIIRSLPGIQKLNTYDMVKNYFKIAYRNLQRQKGHSIINISGLAIGVATTLLMLMYVSYELGYDKHHTHADRIYRVGLHGKLQDSEFHQLYTTAMLASEMKKTFPEVEDATRFLRLGTINFQLLEDSVATQTYLENSVYAVDPALFDIFSMEILVGNPKEALSSTGKVILSESSAARYFGQGWAEKNVLNQSIIINFGAQPIHMTIAGVVKDMPGQSHFHFDFLVSNENIPNSKETNWWNNSYITYLLLEEGASAEELEAKLPALYRKHLPPRAFENGNEWWSFLQPMADIHLRSNLPGEFQPNGNIVYVYIFLVTAVLILVMACVNFVNLTIARANNRFKEIGVRKVIGSTRSQLVFQHLVESQVYCLIAVLLALVLLLVVMPPFRSFADVNITLDYFDYKIIIPGLLLFSLLLGSLAGLYPAFYLTRFAPINTLKGTLNKKGTKVAFKHGLLIFQFVISISIITGSLIISKQLHYIQNKQLGFEKDGVLVLENLYFLSEEIDEFKYALEQNAGIIATSASLSVPTIPFSNVQFKPQDHENMAFDFIFADEDFAETYGVTLDKGRFFSTEFASDSMALVINRAMALKLGWEEPIGKQVQLYGNADLTFEVIGVIEDFHHKSLHHSKIPILILPNFYRRAYRDNYLSIRVAGGNLQEIISHVETTWKRFIPDVAMTYFFMDDHYNNLYKGELQVKTIFKLFSGLTALIALLGLLGLVGYITQQRKKEICIRKVLGASIRHLLGMLAKRFLVLILVALVVTVPLVWVVTDSWLQTFSYRIDIPWSAFVMAGVLTLIVSFVTICFQSLQAVMANPAMTLKDE